MGPPEVRGRDAVFRASGWADKRWEREESLKVKGGGREMTRGYQWKTIACGRKKGEDR